MKYNKIYNSIPYLEQVSHTYEAYTYISSEDKNIPHIKYSDEIQIFLQNCYQEKLINENYATIKNKYCLSNDSCNEDTPMEVIEALISQIIIKDRFVDGFLIERIYNGELLSLLKLLQNKDKQPIF